jgi:hypothetical protein
MNQLLPFPVSLHLLINRKSFNLQPLPNNEYMELYLHSLVSLHGIVSRHSAVPWWCVSEQGQQTGCCDQGDEQ